MPNEKPHTPDLALADVARLPSKNDNTAIATHQIEAGTGIDLGSGNIVPITHTVLLGHRFAIRAILEGEHLTSWGMPFGVAIRSIRPGEYVCNAITLASLRRRALTDIHLPDTPNFEEPSLSFDLSTFGIRTGEQVAPAAMPGTFPGYDRGPRRGVGTRNYIVVLGTSSRTAGLAETLARRMRPLAGSTEGIDGIVPVSHTEGGGISAPNNQREVLCTLSGFLVHPNVAAIVAIDEGSEPINNRLLEDFARSMERPLDEVHHAFLAAGRNPRETLARAEALIRGWLPQAAAAQRTTQPLSGLKLALQCGGSDAFSGVSGNPLAAQMARELVRHGGTAIHAETDEIVGAESYMLQRVRDEDTARRLLAVIERFKERLAWHGSTVEGNPSEGNRLRGLYNILLKSLGAAAKKAPDVRLDGVLDYGEPATEGGFFFMDSPGNDLESIAGEVASGANVIVFVTGNGSVTNFPFVPTLKITTTTTRHELLVNEMDINAGAYLDGTPMEALAREAFARLVETAGGQRTKGERAGHSQVSIWRNWTRDRAGPVGTATPATPVGGQPLQSRAFPRGESTHLIPGWRGEDGTTALERVGLVLPVSLCSSQIARMAAERLTRSALAQKLGLSRFVALPHTEGCGFSGTDLLRHLLRMYVNYARHPSVGAALFLEHGCEKTPNDLVRGYLEEEGEDPRQFGWASVQLDGGIAAVLDKIVAWFSEIEPHATPAGGDEIALEKLTFGMISAGSATPETGKALGEAAGTILAHGGTVVIPQEDVLWKNAGFLKAIFDDTEKQFGPTLGLACVAAEPGLHAVQTETAHAAENITALGASGAQGILVPGGGPLFPKHPLIPVIPLRGDEADAKVVLAEVAKALRGRNNGQNDTDLAPVFQITRGFLGIST